MPFSPNHNDRERDKFEENASDGGTDVRVSVKNDFIKTLDSFVLLAVGNKIEATYPDTVTEIYTFKNFATTLYVLTVIYTDGTKEIFSSVERTA
jgi:hypothetical protein